jgi:hypothetical protein
MGGDFFSVCSDCVLQPRDKELTMPPTKTRAKRLRQNWHEE